jgi:hypothetical protein
MLLRKVFMLLRKVGNQSRGRGRTRGAGALYLSGGRCVQKIQIKNIKTNTTLNKIMSDDAQKRVAELEGRLQALVEKAERVQSGVAVFPKADGSTVAIPRLKRAGGRAALTTAEWDARIGRAVGVLESHGVPASTSNLMRLSIGRKALTAWRARAAARACVEQPVE